MLVHGAGAPHSAAAGAAYQGASCQPRRCTAQRSMHAAAQAEDRACAHVSQNTPPQARTQGPAHHVDVAHGDVHRGAWCGVGADAPVRPRGGQPRIRAVHKPVHLQRPPRSVHVHKVEGVALCLQVCDFKRVFQMEPQAVACMPSGGMPPAKPANAQLPSLIACPQACTQPVTCR